MSEQKNISNIEHAKHYLKVAKVIRYISDHKKEQPGLRELAAHVNLSDFHLQRLFSEWVGISPKQFLMYQTQQYAKSCLRNTSVMQAALESGLSGGGRLHDLMVKVESMTPGEYKKEGVGLSIRYGVHDSPFGYCLIALTRRGICKMAFIDSPDDTGLQVMELEKEWPAAEITRDDSATVDVAKMIFFKDFSQGKSFHLLLKGTPFQLQVWQALLAIPESGLYSYQQVADSIGAHSSVRAVASAIAKNNLAYLIPCHRVIKSTGEFNQYRWGADRKTAMLVSEAACARSCEM